MTTGPLRLGGVPEHFNLPWHLALESETLTDLEVTWSDQPGGTGQMLARLAEAELDVVSILTEGTVREIAKGLPLTILQVYVESPLQWGVFVPGRSTYAEESELGGARIAISRFGSGSHLMAYIHAERLGWSINPEQFVVVKDLNGAIAAFDAGDADLFLWDRFMTSPLVADGRFRQIGTQETPWPSFVIAARNEILTGRTAEVGRVVDAVVGQSRSLMVRDDGSDLVADRYGIAVAQAKEWLASTTFASRRPADPRIAAEVLATLERAGLK